MNADTMMLISLVLGAASLLVLVAILLRVGKLPNIPNTAMTAKELGAELGPAIDAAFKNYVPQPEKLAGAVTAAAEATMKSAVSGMESAMKSALASLEAAHAKVAQSQQAHAGSGEALKKALDAAAANLASSLGAGGDKIQASLGVQAQQIEKASAGLSSQAEKIVASSGDRLQSALNAQAQQIEKAAAALTAQVDKLLTIGMNIDRVLSVSQSVEGALKSISGSEEFKKTLLALQSHLGESDKLLREAAKPRIIKLVEHDDEISVR